MKKILLLVLVLLASCTLNEVIQHHGVHNLEKKQAKLKINKTNKNEIFELIGPPLTQNAFDNTILIYMEKKTSGSKLTKLGKKKLLVNDVLVLEIDNRGILISKKLYNKDDMNNVDFNENLTEVNYTKRSFVYKVLNSMRQKIDDPLGKKRIKN